MTSSQFFDSSTISRVIYHERPLQTQLKSRFRIASLSSSLEVGVGRSAESDHLSREDLNPRPIAMHGVIIVDTVPLKDSILRQDDLIVELLKGVLRGTVVNDVACDKEFAIGSGDKSSSILTPDSECLLQQVDLTDDDNGRFSALHNEGLEDTPLSFRRYQNEQWHERFVELTNFQRENGHCIVPVRWKVNPPLALWVKRQRYQYRLKQEGKHNTLSEDRQKKLEKLGFLWNSRGMAWEERFSELEAFKTTHGHCNIFNSIPKNSPLAIWVKCQRRQFKLLSSGEKSTMTRERQARLSAIGFIWKPRDRSR